MRDLIIATRYAQALFNVVVAQHLDGEVEEELIAFSSALQSSSDLKKFFESPKFDFESKRKFLQRIYQERRSQQHGILINFFSLLLEKKRFYLIHEIAIAFKKISDDFQGQSVAEIKTAVPLDHPTEKMIVAQLEKLAGYHITVKKVVDPKLLGGVAVRVRNRIIDGSVRHELDRMKKVLTQIKTV